MADLNKIPKRSILKKLFYYDIDTGKLYRKISTNGRVKPRQEVGSMHRTKYGITGYKTVSIDKIQYLVHRIIWTLMIGKIPDGLEIDHIDRDAANNRIENLRLVSHKENMQNRVPHKHLTKPPITSKTNELYIHFCNTHKRFKVIYPRCVYRGSFKTIEEAIVKRNQVLEQVGGN